MFSGCRLHKARCVSTRFLGLCSMEHAKTLPQFSVANTKNFSSSSATTDKNEFQFEITSDLINRTSGSENPSSSISEVASSSRLQPIAGSSKVLAQPGFRVQKISRAMKVYLEKAQKREEFMEKEKAEFELGKRHLANMMSLDPDTITQEDIDKAIQYLLPSGLFEPRARPIMKPPEEVQPKQKSAEFGIDGRPFHSQFYTIKPNFYQILYDISVKLESLQDFEDKQYHLGVTESKEKLLLTATDWLSLIELQDKFNEIIRQDEYDQFVRAMEHVSEQPFAVKEKEFIMTYRKPIAQQLEKDKEVLDGIQIETDENGRRFVRSEGTRRATEATVTLWEKGTGKIIVDGLDLSDLPYQQSREIILFPFILLNRLGQFDVEAKSKHKWEGADPFGIFNPDWQKPGETGRAGAIRYAVSKALIPFVSQEEREKMRLAGLLTRDIRKKERHIPGQKGARAKWIWKKR